MCILTNNRESDVLPRWKWREKNYRLLKMWKSSGSRFVLRSYYSSEHPSRGCCMRLVLTTCKVPRSFFCFFVLWFLFLFWWVVSINLRLDWGISVVSRGQLLFCFNLSQLPGVLTIQTFICTSYHKSSYERTMYCTWGTERCCRLPTERLQRGSGFDIWWTRVSWKCTLSVPSVFFELHVP